MRRGAETASAVPRQMCQDGEKRAHLRGGGLAGLADGASKDEIISASIRCFEKFGMRRATMEDIARSAGISRKTVYRHFASKNELIKTFVERESRQVCEEARRRLDLSLPAAELVATAEFTLLKLALADPNIRLFINEDQALQFTLDVLGHHEARNKILFEYWAPVFDQLERTGSLRTDVSRDELMAWIKFVHSMLLTQPTGIGDDPGAGISVRILQAFLSPAIVRQ
jgi:AcrR family transcriptional regulator